MFGNTDLKPLESANFDLGIEHYMGRAGAVSAFLFYKDIDNFVYSADVAGTGDYVGFSEAFTSVNGDSAEVYGLELAYSQKFSWLPAPWSGLLLNANTTFTHSDADIEQFDPDLGAMRSRSISLPGQSDVTGNLTVGWENDKLSLRLSGNYKSSYLDEVGDVLDSRYDYTVDDQLFVDFRRVLLRLHRQEPLQRPVRGIRPQLQDRPDPDPLLIARRGKPAAPFFCPRSKDSSCNSNFA